MKCYLCGRDFAVAPRPHHWVIACDALYEKRGEREFVALPMCEECRPLVMGLVPADGSVPTEDVAIFDFRSGPPNV